MRSHFVLIGMIALFASGLAQARPVSYPGGWTMMQMNDMDAHSLHVHYSPTAKHSVGYKAEYWRDKDWYFQGAQLNYLLKRWNKPASQANAYIKSGLGVAYSDHHAYNGKSQLAGFTGVALDWEDRRFFTSYENRYTEAGEIDSFFMQKARVGVAPYLGDYGDLHSWLMLQVDHNPSKEDDITFTPLVRLFRGEYLGEAGFSDKGDVLLNLVVRF